MNQARALTVAVLLAVVLGGCSQDSARNDPPATTPLGLEAIPGDGEVTLSWQADADGIRTGVYVWQGESSDGLAERDFVAIPATEYVVSGLVNGVTYHFALEAEDAQKRRSDRSATVAATPDSDVPQIPPPKTANFAATPGDGQVVVTWTFKTTRRAGDPKGVHLYWGTNPEDLDQAEFVDYPGTTHTVIDLSNGQDYGFAAEVEDQDGLISERTEVQVVRPHEYDTSGPTILSTSPADGALAVGPDSLLSVTFSESMQPSSIEIIPDPGRALRTFHWNEDASVLVTGPQSPWQQGQTYWIKVTGSDRWGNPIEGVDVFSFTVGYESLVPDVTGFSPDEGLAEVPTNSRISVTFDQPMNADTINLSVNPDAALSFEMENQQGLTYTWQPRIDLMPDTTYIVTVAGTSMSAAGEALGADISFQFSTGSGPDETPPSVVSYLPEHGINGVDRHFEIAIAFSEPMDHAWAQAALVFLNHPTMTGTYTWNDYGTIMRFRPDEDPEYGEIVRWELLGDARDLAGNPIGQDLVSEFQVIRAFEVTIIGNYHLDGDIAILSEPGQWGDHWIDTDDNHIAIGNMNYTNLGPAIQRAFYTYELDVLPEDLTKITYAEMNFVQSSQWGECEDIGNFFLESVAYGPALTLDDFDTPVLDVEVCDEQDVCEVIPYSIEGECPTGWTYLIWYAGVLSAIRNDWDDRNSRMYLSQWRLRIENEVTGQVGQTMRFKSASWGVPSHQRPRLIVRYEIP